MEPLTDTFLAAFDVILSTLRHMNAVMRQHVHGFKGFDDDEIQAHANYLNMLLHKQLCGCGLECCPSQHRLPDSAPAEEICELVRTAIRGTHGGEDLRASSFSQSMLYRRVLLGGDADQPMRIESVELHDCACGRAGYEGEACPDCCSPFDPMSAAMRSALRLIIPELYAARWRWRCGGSSPAHFYRQSDCRTVERPVGEGALMVRHNEGRHDRCPWSRCPDCQPVHPQRGATLWSRAQRVSIAPEDVPVYDDVPGSAGSNDATAAWLECDLTPARRQCIEADCRSVLGLEAGDPVTAGEVLSLLVRDEIQVDTPERQLLTERLSGTPAGSVSTGPLGGRRGRRRKSEGRRS